MDGIEIARVVQDLSKEREKLSTDMADKATTIKRLINENTDLSTRLNFA